MEKTTELIDEIRQEFKTVRNLAEELHERHRIIGALLLSAKSLVPEEHWEPCIKANLGLDLSTVEVVMNGNNQKTPINLLGLPYQPTGALEDKFIPQKDDRANGSKNRKKNRVGLR